MTSVKRLPSSDEVAMLSLKEYDQCIDRLERLGVHFTRSEMKEIGVNRHRIRNKEIARVSRYKKTQRMQFLENRVYELEQECLQLKEQLSKPQIPCSNPNAIPLSWQPLPFDPYEFLEDMQTDHFEYYDR